MGFNRQLSGVQFFGMVLYLIYPGYRPSTNLAYTPETRLSIDPLPPDFQGKPTLLPPLPGSLRCFCFFWIGPFGAHSHKFLRRGRMDSRRAVKMRFRCAGFDGDANALDDLRSIHT